MNFQVYIALLLTVACSSYCLNEKDSIATTNKTVVSPTAPIEQPKNLSSAISHDQSKINSDDEIMETANTIVFRPLFAHRRIQAERRKTANRRSNAAKRRNAQRRKAAVKKPLYYQRYRYPSYQYYPSYYHNAQFPTLA